MFILWFLTFGFVCCQLFLIKFCVYSVYIGWVRARIPSPPTAHKKPRAPLPQHSTLSLRNSGHDHHNDHDDMVTITMMIMMPWSWWWSSWRYSPICSSPPPWKNILCTIYYALYTIYYALFYIIYSIYYILYTIYYDAAPIVVTRWSHAPLLALPPNRHSTTHRSMMMMNHDDDDDVGPMFVIVDDHNDESWWW